MEATDSKANNDDERNDSNGSGSGGGTGSDSERRYRPQKYCAVCGDKAIACNFNAVTCESCKAFFRRNAFKEQRLRCLFENRCVIDRVTRRFCSKCRLLKCIEIGMKREWILTDEQKQIKRVKILQNKQTRQQQQQQQVSTTNLGVAVGASIKCSPDEPTTASSSSSGTPNSQGGGHQYQNQTEPRSPGLQQQQQRLDRKQSLLVGRREIVETRDASTSCPDEADLLSGHILPCCTMAHQCQFCSFKLIPAPNQQNQQQQPTATPQIPTGIHNNHYQHPPNFDHHHHQQQQFQNQHHHQHEHEHEQQTHNSQPQHPSLPHHYHYQQAGLQAGGGGAFYNQQNQQQLPPNMASTSSSSSAAAAATATAVPLGSNRYNICPSSTTGPAGQQLIVQQNSNGEPVVVAPRHHHHHHHHQYLYHYPSGTGRGNVLIPPDPASSGSVSAAQPASAIASSVQHLDCCCSSSSGSSSNSNHVQQPPPTQLLRGPPPPFLNTTGAAAAQNGLPGNSVAPTISVASSPLAATNYAAAAAVASSVPHLHMIEFLQARVQPLTDSSSQNSSNGGESSLSGVLMNNQQVGLAAASATGIVAPLPVEDKGTLAVVNLRSCAAGSGDDGHNGATTTTTAVTVCQAPMSRQRTTGEQADGQEEEGPGKAVSAVPVEQGDTTTTRSATISDAAVGETSSSNRAAAADKCGACDHKASISAERRVVAGGGGTSTEQELPGAQETTPTPTTCGSLIDVVATDEHQQQQQQQQLQKAYNCVAQSATRWNPKTNYVTWKGELFVEPAITEPDVRARVEKLEFSDSERRTIYEMLEATRSLFEQNEKQKNDSSLDDIVFFCDLSLRRLIKTVKKINAFRMLSMDDQIVLLKNACFKILLVRSSVHYNDESEGWIDRNGCNVPLKCMKTEKCHNYERHKELLEKLVPPLRGDRLITAFLVLVILFDPTITLKHTNSVSLDNIVYLCTLRKYLLGTQPEPLAKYERLVEVLQLVTACNEEYNLFFSRKYQPEQITPLLIEIFDISVNQPTR
uniref:Nuclear hormone receptor family member nhr-48 n=1 Tax=Aceria tosichella TaxID=561515 RepID=A0A6G1SAW2_9ACAR